MRIGYLLTSEEFGPRELVAQAVRAQRAGFDGLWISDHFHPWTDDQGHSPFVWSVIGAVAQATGAEMRVGTGVTCPTVRIHPAIVAQAAATSAVMLGGRFTLGVGSGEALNEHVLGDRWPGADERLEMLDEAVEVMRRLWEGGFVDHRGRHYTVQSARIYDLPPTPPPVLISGFGSKATRLAARIGDGYCSSSPDAELIGLYRQAGGPGPVQAGAKVCFGPNEAAARSTAHRLWRNAGLPGELAQVLPAPAHFEQATELVSEQQVAATIPCGPDLDRHREALQQYADAGVDELYVQQIGPDQAPFFDSWAAEILPHFNEDQGR